MTYGEQPIRRTQAILSVFPVPELYRQPVHMCGASGRATVVCTTLCHLNCAGRTGQEVWLVACSVCMKSNSEKSQAQSIRYYRFFGSS